MSSLQNTDVNDDQDTSPDDNQIDDEMTMESNNRSISLIKKSSCSPSSHQRCNDDHVDAIEPNDIEVDEKAEKLQPLFCPPVVGLKPLDVAKSKCNSKSVACSIQ
ncbi:Uncharacterised protein g6838 [Pycnogonum litorale]